MTHATLRAIVCDDDALLRGVLGSMMRDLGYRVVEEVDTTDMALDALERVDTDVLLLDLALRSGQGDTLLGRVSAEHPSVDCVVFSSYIEDADDLRAMGAAGVFQKPDFEGLENWLRAKRHPPVAAHDHLDRRRPPHPVPDLPAAPAKSPSGLEPWASFASALTQLWPGDAVLCLELLEATPLADVWDEMFVADHRLSLARVAGLTLREQDRMSATPDGTIACLLVAGYPEAPSVVFDRIEAMWDRGGFTGTPIGAFTHIRSHEAPVDAMARAMSRIHDGRTTARHPLRLA